ncbi:Hsp20/alpha crystallin family protein [Virgibacillus sp. 179-BFC.A HS]|uniref:Hsp20/alpha crystallin family protein n=1 Tax=Tigheibacillus jepli TaxID=3035914 RepID=A0ABU5CJT7_9BACI|nr:Hsp20/alpha crystallin family protein [Virgibacillus sp. 179-BFC.A HS]MDY0406624.1 Hsp20/alpha crystallin family protein [Virgibacillus sp. 179-BFC.A HS]
MDQFFGDNFWKQFDGLIKTSIPLINMYQTDNEIFIIINVPGMDNIDNMNVYVDYATLELKGEINLGLGKDTAIINEITEGSFERKIHLPYPVRSDKIKATYKNGLVYIKLHRLISETGRKNRVNVHLLEDD